VSGLAPIFVGGTGRSGTTIVARLLAEQPGYMLVPIELRVHAAPGGLADLLEGRVELEWFVARLRDFWYERRSASGEPGGLARICPRERFDVAGDEFAKGFGSDPLGAAEVFVHRTVAPVMEASEASGWVEMTSQNAAAASTLARVFPHARSSTSPAAAWMSLHRCATRTVRPTTCATACCGGRIGCSRPIGAWPAYRARGVTPSGSRSSRAPNATAPTRLS
jgi:hypothetical protein